MSIADKVKLIDDLVTREVEWADGPTDDIQDAWVDLKVLINKGLIADKYAEQWNNER